MNHVLKVLRNREPIESPTKRENLVCCDGVLKRALSYPSDENLNISRDTISCRRYVRPYGLELIQFNKLDHISVALWTGGIAPHDPQ